MDEHFYTELINRLPEGVYCLNRKGAVTLWNKIAEAITGYSAQDVLGRRCSDNLLRHVDDKGLQLCIHGCPMAATMKDGEVRMANLFLHHKDGHRVPVTVRSAPLRAPDGGIIGALETFSQRHSRLDIMEELAHLKKEADTDPLTGIGNRRLGEAELARRMEILQTRGEPFGILSVDIDHFKRVNDTHGHEIGDRVLRMVAWTMAGSLRSQDGVFRWGGEEFLVILPEVDQRMLAEVGERLRILVANSWIDNHGSQLSVTVCLGGALAQDPSVTMAELLARADERMYQCKNSGRNACVIAPEA